MTKDRFLTKAPFATSVAANLGSWLDGESDDGLGQGIYKFDSPMSTIRFYERGFTYSERDKTMSIAYTSIRHCRYLTLSELSAATRTADPWIPVKITIEIENGAHETSMPVAI